MFKNKEMFKNQAIDIKIWVIDYIQKVGTFNLRPEYLTCETCGCFINPKVATKGKSIIKIEKKRMSSCSNVQYPEYEEEYLYKPYYCKIHVPREDG